MPLALAACKPGAALLELTGLTMGTSYSIVAVDHDRKVDKGVLAGAVNTALADVNARMSNWDAGSEISQFNAQAGTGTVAVSDELAQVMAAANQVHKDSEGQFDVTVGPLIDLWGFGAGAGADHAPSDAAIAAALRQTGQERVLNIGAGSLQKREPGAEIYLSAIGKGYGVDRVAQAIRGLGLTDFMVEIGGDLYTSGRNPDGQPWRIGIETPAPGAQGLQDVANVSNAGMATSGDYRNFFEQDGVRYSHIIDPTTGRPITHRTVSATVVTENAMLADAWATGMLTLGRERGLAIAESLDLAVLFIDQATDGTFTEVASSPFKALLRA